jgi:hypothetical protein
LKSILIAGVVAAMACLEAQAQVFYETVAGNTGAATDGSSQFYQHKSFVQQFTTGTIQPGDKDGDGRVMHRFTIQLHPGYVFNPNAGDGGGFTPVETFFQWKLFSNSGGDPGASLLPGLGNISVSGPGLAEFHYAALVSAGEFVLQSNTSYWLGINYAYVSGGLSPSMPVLLPLTSSNAQSGTGTLGGLKQEGDGWGGVLGRMAMQVQVESVPEPSSAGLLVLGMGCWLAKRRRCGR